MMMSPPLRGPVRLALVALVCASVSASFAADDTWHVQDAPVRFTVRLAAPPTHPSAGYFLELPDGGALPGPNAVPKVIGADGQEIKSAVLWQNRDTGIALVFAAPATPGDVQVYLSTAGRPVLWTPASGLTPSAILCTRSDTGVKADAMQLGRLGEVASPVEYRNRAGVPKAPLCISGDLTGRDGPCVIYLLAHIDVKKPGETWHSPLTFAGGTEVRVDGKPLSLKPVSKKAGGTGELIDLSAGLHRVEIFCWSPDSGAANGLMTLTWRPPGTPAGELGGNRPSDLPYAGTPMWESRPFRENEIARSGRAEVIAARGRSGGPVARIALEPVENYWFEGEPPLLLYRLAARAEGNPADTTYTWSFAGSGRVGKPEIRWLFDGSGDQVVTLTAASGDRRSTARALFRPFGTMKTSLDDANSRAGYRQALLEMCEAYPGGQDPTAAWTASHWNNLFRTLELNQSRALVTHLFQVRRDILERKLSPERLRVLRDVFLDYAPRVNPQQALNWIELFEKQARTPQDGALLKIQRAEILAYYLNQPDQARAVLEGILAGRQTDDASEWARIRLADLDFLAGKLDEATKQYAEVQGRVKKRRTRLGDTAPDLNLAGKTSMEISAALREGIRPTAGGPDGKVADWKVNALLDAADSETVKTLIAQGHLLEARQALRGWERDFPMSKISGDFLINEAKLYMALQDWRRAAGPLAAYCEHIDASSYLPAAVEALLECQRRMDAPRDQRLAFCERMKKKLEFHPVAEVINDTIKDLKQP
jgi:hypothetical protein